MLGAGFIALTGDLPGTVEYLKSYGALVTVPCKALITFPLVYHYAAGEHLLSACVLFPACVKCAEMFQHLAANLINDSTEMTRLCGA